jgi:hypothetical protein
MYSQDSTTEEIVSAPLSQLVEGSFDGLISAGFVDDAVYGQFITNGQVHDYKLSSDEFVHQEYRPDSVALNEFSFGFLESLGIRCDSIDPMGAFEFLKGTVAIHSGVAIRNDKRPLVCKSGGVACGGRCLPKGQKCRKGLGGAIGSAVKNAISVTKTKGSVANKLAKAAVIGAGAVAALKGAGAVAEGVTTGVLASEYHKSGDVKGNPISKEEAIDIAKNQMSEMKEYRQLVKHHNKLAKKMNKAADKKGAVKLKDAEKYVAVRERLEKNAQKTKKTLSRLGY